MKNFNVFYFLLSFALLSSHLLGAPGDLDQTFGTGGKVYATPANFQPAHDVAIQADGKIVIVGSTEGPDTTRDFGVVRLNSDGTPDMGFGSNGLVGVAFDNSALEYALNVAIQSDGKILIVGAVSFGETSRVIGVVRLNNDGTIDTSFSGGRVKINIGGADFPGDILLQPDGKIVIAGSTQPGTNADVAVVRLTTDGTFDTTFNGSGKVVLAIGSSNDDSSSALGLQPDGKLVIAGSTRTPTRTYFLLFRIDSGGVLDTSFGNSGVVETALGLRDDYADAVSRQTDGKIVVAGRSHSGTRDRAAFARYNSDGTLDTTFDGDGKLIVDIRPNNPSGVRSVFAYPDGKIIGVGASGGQYALVRLNSDGSPDTRFGASGIVLKSIASQYSSAYRATVQPDGKVVAVGEGSESSVYGYTAARFLTSDSSKAHLDFDGDGKTDIGIFRPDAAEWWINRSSNGSTFAAQFGAMTDKLAPGDYTGDGKADIAIWRPASGEWFILRSEDSSFFSFPFGTTYDVPMPADYDNDGKVDAAIFRASNATWYVRRSSDGGTTIEGFGANGDVPVVADYDGDGKSDIAIYRPSVGQWWIKRSTAGIIAFTFGTSTDKPVQGDYTGDGKADTAFWRPSTGEWYILRSEDFSYYSQPFGTATDIPSPGDYDGDGTFDPTVFRPSSATWFVARSTAGTLIQQFGSTGDRPVPNAFVP